MPDAAKILLPPAVIDHIYSEDLDVWYRRFYETRQLFDVQRDAVDEAVRKVYTRESTLDVFLKTLEDIFGAPERAKAIASDILGNDFLKIENHLGVNIAAYIKAIGGDPAQYIHRADPDAVAEELAQRATVASLADPTARHRAIAALTSFLSDARTRQQMFDALSRSAKIGGAGLVVEEAERLCAAAETKKTELRAAGVKFRQEKAPVQNSSFNIIKAASGAVIQPEDEDEIAAIRQAMPASGRVNEAVIKDKIIARVIARIGAKFRDAATEQRFRFAVEARLRDVRDRNETLDLLMRPTGAGGLGIPADRAKKLLEIIEEEIETRDERRGLSREARSAEQETTASIIASGVKPSAAIPVEQVESGAQAAAPQLLPHLDAIGAPCNNKKEGVSAILPSPPPSVKSPIIALPPPPPVAELVHPVPPKIVPQQQAPIAKEETISKDKALTTGTRPLPAVNYQPSISVNRIIPSGLPRGEGAAELRLNSSGRRKIQDIRPVPMRLVGPIEELAQLTVADFRKIAPTPEAAATRIIEKLALLENESYTKRAEGLRALRGSPLLAAYSAVLRDALTAKRSVDEELRARAGDGSALNAEEFTALRNLNAQLRV